MDLPLIFNSCKQTKLYGRYITNKHIEPILKDLKQFFKVDVIGTSVLNKPIYTIKVGSGKTKVLIWSQMHGNESTTTKAIFDMLSWLKSDNENARTIKSNFSFYIIPILNPDGAELYTRQNFNKVDLNRDAYNLAQPEIRLLMQAFNDFKPDYCYNMHDQRTIFGLEDENGVYKPATVSFLAPAYNEERDINDVRLKAINVIVAMNETLQQYIPGQVGRFDDSYNKNCIGDSLQSLGVPTILFEAGHYEDDYERENSRKFIFFSLLSGFNSINENVIVKDEKVEYFKIPQNKKLFYDFKYKNVKINYENKEKISNFASQYKEVLIDNSVTFQAFINEIDNLDNAVGHIEYDGQGEEFNGNNGNNIPKNDTEADFFIGSRKFVNGKEIK